jgi:hypothetical protein
MPNAMRLGRCVVAAGLLAIPVGAGATEPPLAGCYQRAYDAAHLAAHKRQLVVRVTLSVKPAAPATRLDKTHIADGNLKIWVRGKKQSFDSDGACRAEGDGLLCNGSLSAAEAETCKSKRDGIRQCRMGSDDAGSFQIVGKPQGVLVTIHERLELVQAPYDGGPFLYFSPSNAENHAFLLNKTAEACK